MLRPIQPSLLCRADLTILVKGLRSYHAAIRCMSAQVRRRQQPLPQQAHTQQQHVAPCCGMHQHQNMASWCGMPLQTHRQPSVPTPAHSHTQEAPSLASSPPSSPATSPRSWTAKLDPEWEPDWVNVWYVWSTLTPPSFFHWHRFPGGSQCLPGWACLSESDLATAHTLPIVHFMPPRVCFRQCS